MNSTTFTFKESSKTPGFFYVYPNRNSGSKPVGEVMQEPSGLFSACLTQGTYGASRPTKEAAALDLIEHHRKVEAVNTDTNAFMLQSMLSRMGGGYSPTQSDIPHWTEEGGKNVFTSGVAPRTGRPPAKIAGRPAPATIDGVAID